MQQTPYIITIDGPAGTGKSTVAKRLAQALKIAYLDTGAMYRGVAWTCLNQGHFQADDVNQPAVLEIAEGLNFALQAGQLCVDGQPVGSELRTPAVSEASSRLATIPELRKILVRRQQKLGAEQSLLTEGRDQGTVVFPHAICKIFLTARPEIRARRRCDELSGQPDAPTYQEILAEQVARDERDQNRAVAPLRPAADAILFDTSELCLEDVLAQLMEIIQQKLRR